MTAAPWSVRPRRDVVAVTGGDAERFLQGQVSQDVVTLAVGDQAWALLLQPQGKLDAWLRVTRTAADHFELDVDTGFGDAVVERLMRFLIRTDASVTVAATDVALDHRDVSEVERIRAGVPAMGAELDASTIPAEVGRWFIDTSVSFTKGCYCGQELVARIDSRGSNVARLLRVVELADGTDTAVGDELRIGGEAVGRVTSWADDVALAYVKRSVTLPSRTDLGQLILAGPTAAVG